MLAESVAARLREHHFSAKVVQIHVRDNELQSYGRQKVLLRPTNLSGEIVRESMELFRQSYHWQRPIRSLGVCCSQLVSDNAPKQLCFFEDDSARRKKEEMERTVDALRGRFGHFCLQRGCMLEDRSILEINPKDDQRFHAFAYQM